MNIFIKNFTCFSSQNQLDTLGNLIDHLRTSHWLPTLSQHSSWSRLFLCSYIMRLNELYSHDHGNTKGSKCPSQSNGSGFDKKQAKTDAAARLFSHFITKSTQLSHVTNETNPVQQDIAFVHYQFKFAFHGGVRHLEMPHLSWVESKISAGPCAPPDLICGRLHAILVDKFSRHAYRHSKKYDVSITDEVSRHGDLRRILWAFIPMTRIGWQHPSKSVWIPACHSEVITTFITQWTVDDEEQKLTFILMAPSRPSAVVRSVEEFNLIDLLFRIANAWQWQYLYRKCRPEIARA